MADNEIEAERVAREDAERLERERKQQEDQDRQRREDEDRQRRELWNKGWATHDAIAQVQIGNDNVFNTPQQNAAGAVTLLDTIMQEAPNHVTPLLNNVKALVAAIVPTSSGSRRGNDASVHTPTGSRLPHLHSGDYCYPEASSSDPHRCRDMDRNHSINSPYWNTNRRERWADSEAQGSSQGHTPRGAPRDAPRDLRDTHNARRQYQDNDCRKRPLYIDDDDVGIPAFTPELPRVDWPTAFKPTGIEKYDGKTDPEAWLTVYTLAIRAVGGDSKAMANYLPVALEDSARNWLTGLPRGTIATWFELCEHFIVNFQGTFERPGSHFDLYNVMQKSDVSLKDYIRRFSEKKKTKYPTSPMTTSWRLSREGCATSC